MRLAGPPRSFNLADSYAVVLTVQLATVWFTLRVSQAGAVAAYLLIGTLTPVPHRSHRKDHQQPEGEARRLSRRCTSPTTSSQSNLPRPGQITRMG